MNGRINAREKLLGCSMNPYDINVHLDHDAFTPYMQPEVSFIEGSRPEKPQGVVPEVAVINALNFPRTPRSNGLSL